MQSPNPQFVRANITPSALKQLQVNALMIVDLQGDIVLSSAEDLASGAPLDIDFAARKALPADFPRAATSRAENSPRGLIRTNHGVMMIASAPVLDGNGGGPPLGFVIMGQLLDAPHVSALGSHAQAALSMLPQPQPAGERTTETDEVTRIDRTFSDVYGRPLLTLRVEVPRRITAQGRAAVTYASVYLVGAAVAALLALLIVLNRVILGPLARVTRHAITVGEGTDLGARLNLQSRDEIGRLAQEFDRMVARVEQSRRQLVDQSFHAGFAELAKGVLHNLGNAMTPFGGPRCQAGGERLRAAPVADLIEAAGELVGADSPEERLRDLKAFMHLGCREMGPGRGPQAAAPADLAAPPQPPAGRPVRHPPGLELLRQGHSGPVAVPHPGRSVPA